MQMPAVATAQETVAVAQGHLKQFEHLAVSSHEAVKAVQVNAALPVLQFALSLCVLRQQALLHVGPRERLPA